MYETDDEMRPVYDAFYANDAIELMNLVLRMIETSKLDIPVKQAKVELQKLVDSNNLNAIVAIAAKLNKPRS